MEYLLADCKLGSDKYRWIIFWLIAEICNQYMKPPIMSAQTVCLVKGLQSVLLNRMSKNIFKS